MELFKAILEYLYNIQDGGHLVYTCHHTAPTYARKTNTDLYETGRVVTVITVIMELYPLAHLSAPAIISKS